MSPILNTNLFLATHVTRIDGKGRVSFPASFRTALAARNSQGVVIYRSPSGAVIEGMTIERMQHMAAGMETLSPNAPERAFFETAIFGTAQFLAIDGEGRCSLPRAMLDAIGIAGDVAFLGRGATFEIWEPRALEARHAEAAEALKSGAIALPTLQLGGAIL
jgi:MraZ protein